MTNRRNDIIAPIARCIFGGISDDDLRCELEPIIDGILATPLTLMDATTIREMIVHAPPFFAREITAALRRTGY